MKWNHKVLVTALAACFPMAAVQAQTTADLQKEIDALKAQLKQLETLVQSVKEQSAGASAQEVNRIQQKIDLTSDEFEKSGFKGLKFKGVIEARYLHDKRLHEQGFDAGNGNAGTGMFEIAKEVEGGATWLLRLTPGAGNNNLVHEATVSLPLGEDGTRFNAGLTPDYQGYESSFANQNPLVTHNLLWNFAGPTNYTGVGLSYALGPWAVKWMFGNIDAQRSGKSPGLAYRADYTVSEFTYIGFAGAHSRTTRRYDLIEVDAGYNRGDWILNGQLNFGQEKGSTDADGNHYGSADGRDTNWWGLSALAGYKINPRTQLLGRFDYIRNRKNGGGIYYNDGSFGPERDASGAVIDLNRGTNRYQLSAGVNYLLMPSTTWKTEITLDRASGYNFVDAKTGEFKKSNVRLGTSVLVSF